MYVCKIVCIVGIHEFFEFIDKGISLFEVQ